MINKRIKLSKEEKERIKRELQKIVGEKNILHTPETVYPYSGTGMVYPKFLPDFVVLPSSVDEIQKIVKLANKYRIPITPSASATQEAGIYPFFGGIVLDLMRMDRILEIDVERGYAVLEPGVRIGDFALKLKEKGMRCTVGSFPPSISVLGNYTQVAVNSHRSSGILHDILGLEVVLPNGEIMRTGSMAFSHSIKNMTWHSYTNSFPDITSLFINSHGTLGVITKGAVRIYNLNEPVMPLAGFDSYRKSVEFMKRLTRANLCQHVCVWHWCLYTIIDHLERFGHGAPSEILVYDPWSPPDDRPYNVVVPSMSGEKEDMDAHEKVFERIAKECGGFVCTDYIKEKFPGAYKFFYDHYALHLPTNTFMGAYGEGFPMMGITFTDPVRVSDLEKWGLKFLRKSPLKVGLAYYSHSVDQTRCVFLRMTPFVVAESSKKERERAIKVRKRYMEIAMKKYGGVPIRPPYEENFGETLDMTGEYGEVLRKIKRTIDPLNIMNPGYSLMMYGKKLLKE